MTEWMRLIVPAQCGRCSVLQPAGTAVLCVQPKKLTRRLIRCQACAGDAPELPPVIMKSQTTKKMQPLAKTAKAAADKWLPYKERD